MLTKRLITQGPVVADRAAFQGLGEPCVPGRSQQAHGSLRKTQEMQVRRIGVLKDGTSQGGERRVKNAGIPSEETEDGEGLGWR